MISTKGRYAMRIMIDLAQQDPNEYITLESISQRQEISKKYLEIIVRDLVHADMLKGTRGKGGGYKLTRTPSEYTAGEIIEAVEGPLAPVACLLPDATPCNRKDFCLTLPMWKKYTEMEHNFFYSITIQDLLENKLENKLESEL